jgi:hypothetical protein
MDSNRIKHMENTSGFYKEKNGEWYFAPNFVYAPTYTLLKELKDTYEYPLDGWVWYNEAPSSYLLYINNTDNDNT